MRGNVRLEDNDDTILELVKPFSKTIDAVHVVWMGIGCAYGCV